MQLSGRRIGLLTASASRLGGGVFEAVVAQAAMIRALGGEPHVLALEDACSAQDSHRFEGARVTVCPVVGPRQVGYSPALDRALDVAELDCLHLHGIWMAPSRHGSQWALRHRRPYFVSPHGMLDPWITARGRWKKALARAGYERANWQSATALHALTAREAGDIAREAGRHDSIVIPNPGPALDPAAGARAPIVAYIGRIHSKKNLLALVAGWRAATRPAGARLRIAGWGDPADVAALEQAVAAADGSVEFLGPVYGEAKAALIAEARFVVLPSLSEGLPMAILEAWARGTPTVMTGECNLPEGFAEGAARECGYAATDIAAVMGEALALNEAGWQAMSDAALRLAGERFSAKTVARRWEQVYGDAIAASAGGGIAPGFALGTAAGIAGNIAA